MMQKYLHPVYTVHIIFRQSAIKILLAFCCSIIITVPARLSAHGAVLPPGFIESLVADSLNPTSMCMDQDGRIFLAQKDGRILIIRNSSQLLAHPLVTIATDVTNERGLQGIALHPDFPDSAYIYAFYAIPLLGRNRVSRFTVLGDLVVPGSERVIIELDPMTGTVHNGGALAFGPQDGMLYISTGEAGKGLNSQDTSNVLGKILRLRPDGSIPESNPYFHRFTGKNRAIYAMGFRNPFSMTFDQVNGLLYVCDVGSGFFEEINIIYPGKNYGWPLIEGNRTTQQEPVGYQDPLYTYPHGAGCAIVGAAFYQPTQQVFPDSLRNHFFFADYCNGTMYHMDPANAEAGALVFATEIHRPLAMLTGPDGSMYYLAREGQGGGSQEDNKVSTDGTLWRIQYTGNGKPYVSVDPRDEFLSVGEDATFSIKALGEAPIQYQWYLNDELLTGATDDSLVIDSVTLTMNESLVYCMVTNSIASDTSASAMLLVTSDTRPELYIDLPLSNHTYQAGDTLRFWGHAIDADNEVLPASFYSWRIDFHHNTHSHPAMQTISGVDHGTYIIPVVNETDPGVWYRLHFFATDSVGLDASSYVDILPELTDISFNGPVGMHFNVDGKILTLPVTVQSVKKLRHSVLANERGMVHDTIYAWKSYGNGLTDLLFEFSAPTIDTSIELTYVGFELGNGSGLLGEYFDDPEADLDGEPNVILIDTVIDFAWGAGPPVFNFPKDLFTVRWTGWVTPLVDGAWTFIVRSDDGCRLWVDDQLLIDEWHGQSPREHQGTLNLEGGHNYSIRLEYLEEDGGAEVGLYWSHPDFEKEIIPRTQLIPARLVGKGTLEGVVWIDEDYDHEKDSNEIAVQHTTMILYQQSDTSYYAATDVVDGQYLFENVKEGMYQLQAIYTGPDSNLEPSFGVKKDGFSDPVFVQTGFTHQHSVAFSQRRGRIVGKVWVDENANGFPEDDERGLEELLVIMYKGSAGMYSIEETNSEGIFTCEDVEPGLIRLELANVPGMNAYTAGVGLNVDFTTSAFEHTIGQDHFFLLGLVPISTLVSEESMAAYIIYPNPVSDHLYIRQEAHDISSITLWNEYGALVIESRVEGNEEVIDTDISEIAAGIYFVELRTLSGARAFRRIVKI